jgi:HEAT repeat protein
MLRRFIWTAALVLAGSVQGQEASPSHIGRLIRQLGSDNYNHREAASRELETIGGPALTALRKATANGDLEVRRRAAELIEILQERGRLQEVAALQGLWVLATAEWMGERTDQAPARTRWRGCGCRC